MSLNEKLAEIRALNITWPYDLERIQKQSIAAALDEVIMRCNMDRTALTWVIGEIRNELSI